MSQCQNLRGPSGNLTLLPSLVDGGPSGIWLSQGHSDTKQSLGPTSPSSQPPGLGCVLRSALTVHIRQAV